MRSDSKDSTTPEVITGPVVTMGDVAKEVGLHRTTVSLALRGHPKIPEVTRARVQEAVERLGYRPNPLVSALMSFRAKHRKPVWKSTLGILTAGPSREAWREPKAYGKIFEGAYRRAEEMGYALQPFWAEDPELPMARFNKMLQTRNIPGCLVAPVERPAFAGLNWDSFSAVAIGYSLAQPDLHRVSNDYYHSMQLAVDRCQRAGHRRIGLALDRVSDSRVDHLWQAAYLMEQRVRRDCILLEPFMPEGDQHLDALRVWFEREKPEVIISLPRGYVRRQIMDLKHPASRRVRWVSLGCYEKGENDSGVFQNYPMIGAAAVDFLISLVNRGERGVPRQSQILLIKSEWNEGQTLRPVGRGGRTMASVVHTG